jgi:hypothetical protein
MAWANLHDVTKTLTDLLNLYIVDVLGFPNLSVTDQLPTTLTSAQRTLNLYLYHAREDPSGRNLMPIGADFPPAPHTPLGLELFYLLTAHHHVAADVDAEMQQRLMGYAIKTFHDVALITDTTAVSGTPVMAQDVRGLGNRFEVVPRNPTPEEALSIWTTGNREFTRLAAYYGVRAVFLDPLPAKTESGIVLTVGTHVKPIGTLRLGDTHSSVRFALPDGSPASAESTPATAFLVPPKTAPAPHPWPNVNATVTIEMEASSSDLRVVLRHPAWRKLSPPIDKIVVDEALNAALDWTLAFAAPGVVLQIANTLNYRDETGAVKSVAMYPGLCGVTIESVIDQTLQAGALRTQVQASNEASFIVAPRVQTEMSGTSGMPPGIYRLAMGPGSMVAPGAGDPAFDIELAVNGEVYGRFAGTGDPPAGQYKVVPGQSFANPENPPPTVTRDAIDIRPFAAAPHGVDLPVRLAIGGAHAQPFWVRFP